MPIPRPVLRRVRFALLLLPALLGGCYVVPVVPVQRPYGPVYRPYPGPGPGPYYRGYRGYYGQAEPAGDVHIEVSSSAR